MAPYIQDTAPPGGYKDIEWARVLGKRASGWKILGAFLGIKVLGITWLVSVQKAQLLERYEDTDWRVALMPFMVAESDRMKMKKYMRMKEEEADLMKGFPNWQVGTWKGLELYHDQHRKFDEGLEVESNTYDFIKQCSSYSRLWKN